jgi:hypothetical protein
VITEEAIRESLEPEFEISEDGPETLIAGESA